MSTGIQTLINADENEQSKLTIKTEISERNDNK